MRVTAFYASILAPLFLFLSLRVIRCRRENKVAVGDSGNKDVLRRMRVQANFAEYVPFALVLIGLAEGLKTPPILIHIMGLTLLTGRTMHAYGVSQQPEPFKYRVRGMILTGAAISFAALACFVGSIRG